MLLNRLGRFSCWCRSYSLLHTDINSNLGIGGRSWSWGWLCVWLFLACCEVLFPVIFMLSEVMIEIGIVVTMVFALPLHFISVWVLDVVVRIRVRVAVVDAGLVVGVHLMGCVVSRVPSLLLFIVVFAGLMSFVVVTEIVMLVSMRI